MAITYLSGQRIQGLSEAGAVDGLGTAGLLNYNNGTYDASGKIGRCYSVSSTEYSSTASGAKSNFKFLHEPSCKWSIAFWLKVASSGSGIADGKIIMGTADGGTGEIGTCLKMNGSSALLLHIRGSSSYVARPSSNNGCIEEDGNWHHYVMTYDQTLADYNMKIWKDGSAFTIQSDGDKESDDNSTSDPAEYFTVGGGGIGSGFAFAIDEISTWSRVLSETEAEFLYDNNGGGTAQVTTNMSNLAGLKTYWNLNESTGNWANDASPTDEKTTVTDVPTGSQFEETDTRKFYQFKEGGGNQVENVFNSSNTYTFAESSYVTVTAGDDPTGKVVTDFSASAFSGYSKAQTSITSGNSKTFVIKFTWNRGSGDGANNNTVFFSSFDWADNTPSSGHKFIKFFTANGNKAIFRLQTGSETVSSADDDDFLQATGTTRYYTITGNGSTWKGQSWSNSARTTDEETTADLSFPSDWTTTAGIDKWGVGSWSGSHATSQTISEVSIKYNSGIASEWVERGTAI